MPVQERASEVSSGRDPLLGTVVANRYRVIAPLGRGGMARIYRAEQLGLEREVALKILQLPKNKEGVAQLVRRFSLEAASVAKLRHNNTVVVHDYGEADGRFFLAMELVEGESLEAVLDTHRHISERKVVSIALQVCRSLQEAHEKGMVHRDIKPGNIMLSRHKREPNSVKVLDFGLVKIQEETNVASTQQGTVLGTPLYIAPEQASGSTAVGPQSDVYSLGAVMFHALTGRPPFESESKYVLYMAHINRELPRFSDVCDHSTSPFLEAVVRKCMEKAAIDRYRSMRELALALESYQAGVEGAVEQPAPAAPASVVSIGGAETNPSVRRSGWSKSEATVTSSSSRIRAGAITICLVALVALAWRFGGVAHDSRRTSSLTGAPQAESETQGIVEDPPLRETLRGGEAGQSPPPGHLQPLQVKKIRLTSSPAGAAVFVQGKRVGRTPVSLEIPEAASMRARLDSKGYVRRWVTLDGSRADIRVKLERSKEQRRALSLDNLDPWAE